MAIYTEQYKNMTIEIFQDEDADSPRDWCNLGTMVCFHRRYDLGDKHSYSDGNEFFLELAREIDAGAVARLEARLERLENDDNTMAQDVIAESKHYHAGIAAILERGAVMLPLFLYDHSSITMSTSSGAFRAVDGAGWDWGQVGVIYVTIERAKKEWSKTRVTEKFRARVEKVLRQEVETYDDYLTGNVYGYDVLDQDGNSLDSCWGFFGDYDNAEYGALTEARSAADYHAADVAAELDTLRETTLT